MAIDVIALALEDIGRWDSQLLELIQDNKIDPWDIDIKLLTQRYLAAVKDARDFRIPGKAVITAAVLLRMKSERLHFEPVLEHISEQKDFSGVVVPPLRPVRRLVERKITVIELVDALRDAFEIQKRKMHRKKLLREIMKFGNVVDMTGLLNNLKEALKYLFAQKERVTVEELIGYREFPLLFLAILHLANEGYIEIYQEDWNGPITLGRYVNVEGSS